MTKLTRTQRSAAAKKGWKTRRGNPYIKRHDGEFSTDLVHDRDLPNITLQKAHLAYGGKMQPPLLNLSSGRIRSKSDLDEFITTLRSFRKALVVLP